MQNTSADKLVTIARYGILADADLAKAILAQEGVDAVLADVHSRVMIPLPEVRLQVLQADALEALDILRASAGDHTGIQSGLARLPQCPNCGSYDLIRPALPRLIAVVSWLLVGIPLLFMARRRRCRSCGHQWKA